MSKDYGNDTFVTNAQYAKSGSLRARYSIVNSFAWVNYTTVSYTSSTAEDVSLEIYTVGGALLGTKKELAAAGINRSTLPFIGPQLIAGQYLVALRV